MLVLSIHVYTPKNLNDTWAWGIIFLCHIVHNFFFRKPLMTKIKDVRRQRLIVL